MKIWLGALLLIAAPMSYALGWGDLLGPEAAFPVSAHRASADEVVVSFDIADGYALYRSKLRVEGIEGFVVDEVQLPPGERVEDPDFGVMELYRGRVDVVVSGHAWREGPVGLRVTSQGCADVGVCFNPVSRIVTAAKGASGG